MDLIKVYFSADSEPGWVLYTHYYYIGRKKLKALLNYDFMEEWKIN